MLQKRGIMGFLSDFYANIDKEETSLKNNNYSINKGILNNNINNDNSEGLIKILLSWIVGGAISLLPTFTFLYKDSDINNISVMLSQFVSNKDLFLVITTLTTSAMFEVVFSNSNSRVRYFIISFGILLMLSSIHIFTFLQYGNTMPLLPYIGTTLFALCILNSIVGYYIVCKRG